MREMGAVRRAVYDLNLGRSGIQLALMMRSNYWRMLTTDDVYPQHTFGVCQLEVRGYLREREVGGVRFWVVRKRLSWRVIDWVNEWLVGMR